MFSPMLLSKVSNIGRYFLTNKHILSPKINGTSLFPFAGLKSHTAVELPDKPKKPPSPFFKFIKEHKPVVLKEHPDWKQKDVVRKCSEDWKSVHSTIKARYESEYKDELADYAVKYMEYSAKLSDEQKDYIKEINQERRESSKKRKIKKKIREFNKPKKPASPFTMYLMDQAKIRNRKYNELMIELKGQWEQLDEVEKLRYSEQAEAARKQYFLDLENWEKKMLLEGNSDLVRVKTLEEKRPASTKKAKRVSKRGLSKETKSE